MERYALDQLDVRLLVRCMRADVVRGNGHVPDPAFRSHRGESDEGKPDRRPNVKLNLCS